MFQPVDYQTWKTALLAEIDINSSTTERGDRFVQRVLRDYYQLSEDDAINSTDPAGAGDRGIDAVHITLAEKGQPPEALVVQGKYGTIGQTFSLYQEYTKFDRALLDTRDGQTTTDAVQKCASVLESQGVVRYIFATVNRLSSIQQSELEDVRTLAHQHFGENFLVDAISLEDVYHEIVQRRPSSESVELACVGVEPLDSVFTGVATLVDIYLMLHNYAQGHQGVLDSIYDRNVRKWLGKRARSVNAGIAHTLQESPENFVAYNNGITIVCRSFSDLPNGLKIDSPQIVNGCQTTRTLYDFMENRFAGITNQLHARSDAERYRRAFLPFKLIAVDDLDNEVVKNITRFSNKQNAVRGRDFLTLEDDFRRLKRELAERDYYLEVQTGEYSVLPKAEREKYPPGRVINAFDALRFYGAAIYGKPHTAFGRSGDFTPGGREFDEVIEGLTADDLIVPWLIARHAADLGYSVGAKWHAGSEDHRNQTRYFFLYIFFRTASHILHDTPHVNTSTRVALYNEIMRLRDHQLSQSSATPFDHFMSETDAIVATYMHMAQHQKWYTDRNAFLKSESLVNEEKLISVSGMLLVKVQNLRKEAAALLNSNK